MVRFRINKRANIQKQFVEVFLKFKNFGTIPQTYERLFKLQTV